VLAVAFVGKIVGNWVFALPAKLTKNDACAVVPGDSPPESVAAFPLAGQSTDTDRTGRGG